MGNSTISWHPFSLSSVMMILDFFFSVVNMTLQVCSPAIFCIRVGFFFGRCFTTLSTFSSGTCITIMTAFFPTTTLFKRRPRISIFFFFHSSAIASSLAISFVELSKTVSTIRRLFAVRDDPVSVSSIMASANFGGFASVAPHENSTFAFILCFFKKDFTAPTSSVEIVFPSRSSTECIGESLGTAITHFIFFCSRFAYSRSTIFLTLSSDSSIQSSPDIPASIFPCPTYVGISCGRSTVQTISGSSILGE